MKLLKPSWVNHDDKPIFSVDIHPTGKRFATGGQGGDSGRVVVWNLNSVLYESVELDPNVPKMLCQMDNHLACVNCVRWSNGGRYLASGGDDRLVMVWGLSVVANATPSKHKAELWRCIATLRGHAGDVLDLAWSPLDKWLASCSVDNSIIIWNAEKLPEMVCVLNGHTGLVKGVAWDPVGKYLASQSDDKSLRVWKTADWAPETVVTEPFEECGGTTHVLRLSWSPDGQYVVSAHAMNGGGPTAQVLERDGWRCDKDFVGHRKAVTCARFNSNIFVKEGKKCCCAAVGARDRALSIWLTSLKRPLVVVHDLFADTVLDLSWSSDGLNLLACSSDGTVACIQFTNKEIGTPLTMDEKNAFYEKIYGKCLANDSALSNLLVECPEVLLARERGARAGAPPDRPDRPQVKPVLTSSSSPVSLRPVDRQIETRTSDGKRRITPIFIPVTMVASESQGSIPSGSENCFSTSSQSKSRIRVEKRDDIVIHPNVSNHGCPAPTKPADTGLDQRLRKRGAGALPGPRSDEARARARRRRARRARRRRPAAAGGEQGVQHAVRHAGAPAAAAQQLGGARPRLGNLLRVPGDVHRVRRAVRVRGVRRRHAARLAAAARRRGARAAAHRIDVASGETDTNGRHAGSGHHRRGARHVGPGQRHVRRQAALLPQPAGARRDSNQLLSPGRRKSDDLAQQWEKLYLLQEIVRVGGVGGRARPGVARVRRARVHARAPRRARAPPAAARAPRARRRREVQRGGGAQLAGGGGGALPAPAPRARLPPLAAGAVPPPHAIRQRGPAEDDPGRHARAEPLHLHAQEVAAHSIRYKEARHPRRDAPVPRAAAALAAPLQRVQRAARPAAPGPPGAQRALTPEMLPARRKRQTLRALTLSSRPTELMFQEQQTESVTRIDCKSRCHCQGCVTAQKRHNLLIKTLRNRKAK